MAGRTLSAAEFERVKQAVMAAAPPNMTEADFDRWMAHAWPRAIAEAEALPPTPEGGALKRFEDNLYKVINPVTLAQGLYESFKSPEATGRTLEGIYNASAAQLGQAREAAARGRVLETFGHLGGAIPIIGPAAVAAGEQIAQGDIAGGLGTGTGLVVGSLATPARVGGAVKAAGAVPQVPAVLAGALTRANPAAADAVAYGFREGLPVDVATASGNRFLRFLQEQSERSVLGNIVGQQRVQGQGAAMAEHGLGLAERAAPGAGAQTPVTAGASTEAALQATRKGHAGEASRQYQTVEKAEGGYGNAEYVPGTRVITPEMAARMKKTLGAVPTPAELDEMARILAEMDAVPYQPGKLVRERGAALDTGAEHYVPRAGGAEVYYDILQAAPGTSNPTRAVVQAGVQKALQSGVFDYWARGALDVAKKRLKAGSGNEAYAGLSKPSLPPDAGQLPPVVMMMPVNLGAAKPLLAPLAEELAQKRALTGALLGEEGRVAVALETLLKGPDHVPLTQAEAALSAIKRFARGKASDTAVGVRSRAQGLASEAVEALDAQILERAEAASPEVVEALVAGRAATRAKYQTIEVLKTLRGGRGEPVTMYRKLVQPGAGNLELLRAVVREAPTVAPLIARAFLEDLLATAGKKGEFASAQTIHSRWKALGPEKTAILFPDAALVKDLDNFFQLAERMKETVNAPGSGLTVGQVGELGGLVALARGEPWGALLTAGAPAIAGLLAHPGVARLLVQGLRLPAGATTARARIAAEITRLVPALGTVAPGMALPQAAEGTEPAPVRIGPYTIQREP